MFYDMGRWGEWPYGAHAHKRVAEINEILEVASLHEAGNDPETVTYEEAYEQY